MGTTLSTLKPVTFNQLFPKSIHITQAGGISNNPQIFPTPKPLTITLGSLTEKNFFLFCDSILANLIGKIFVNGIVVLSAHQKKLFFKVPKDTFIHDEVMSALDIL